MQLIRKSTFETNSSSCHTLTISDVDEVYDTIEPDDEGTITFNGGEFGWGVDVYTDALTKANYIAVTLTLYSTSADTDVFEQVIKEQTGCKDIVYDIDDDNSYIDHQSIGCIPFSLTSYNDLRNFIFNPKSVLDIDNDNH
jgi:hypothetical protein